MFYPYYPKNNGPELVKFGSWLCKIKKLPTFYRYSYQKVLSVIFPYFEEWVIFNYISSSNVLNNYRKGGGWITK